MTLDETTINLLKERHFQFTKEEIQKIYNEEKTIEKTIKKLVELKLKK